MLQILNASYALGKDVNLKEFHILSVEEYYGRVWHNDVHATSRKREDCLCSCVDRDRCFVLISVEGVGWSFSFHPYYRYY